MVLFDLRSVGLSVGDCNDGRVGVGAIVGKSVRTVGELLGRSVALVGCMDGTPLGCVLASTDGDDDGNMLGRELGDTVGRGLGA